MARGSGRILIVDDDRHFRMLMTRHLRKAGYSNIDSAAGREEAVSAAKKDPPDLVILDTLLPGTDGFEICRELRAIPLPKARIIITTGLVDAVDAGKAVAAGADDYVVKTSDYVPLMEAARKWLPL